MSINLTPEQQNAIEQAKAKARLAGARIREIRKGVRLDLKGMSIRELAHIGHKY